MDTAEMTTAVCELGPAVIRRLDCSTTVSVPADRVLSEAALDGGDGRTALVGNEPLPLPVVWRTVLQPLLHGVERALLIHPSWWPVTRINAARDAAADLVRDVELSSRAQILAKSSGASVIEIAAQWVVVSAGGVAVTVQPRSPSPETVASNVVAAVLNRGTDGVVLIDAPPTGSGADVLHRLISEKLVSQKVRVRAVTDAHVRGAATIPPQNVCATKRRRRPTLLAATVAAAALAAGTPLLWSRDQPEQHSTIPVSSLIEGRVVMDVPADWTVQRITGGPGSARVQVMSPTDSDAMLHLTQSQTPAVDLTATAVTLRRAVDREAAGTFIDFDPTDSRAGRPAVTYRELRPGREILWVVLVDDDVRISIGCQQAPSREESIATACDGAVGSARRAR
jgi:type VII secretion-associated protein (TIGR03931 family)